MNRDSLHYFDKSLKLPVYHQVYLTLKDWIFSGHLGPGAKLPTEAELCETFSVSRITIRKSIDLLKAENLVSREQGRGTFVTREAAAAPFTQEMSRLLGRLAQVAERTQVVETEIEQTNPDEEVQKDLQVSANDKVWNIQFVRISKGIRTGILTAQSPVSLGVAFSVKDVETKSLLNIVDSSYVKLGSADQLVGAILADPKLAKRLDIAVGAPMVQIRLVASDTQQQPIIRIIANYRADYYKHHTHLVRRPDATGTTRWTQSDT